jgi:ribosome maturation factor RimP
MIFELITDKYIMTSTTTPAAVGSLNSARAESAPVIEIVTSKLKNDVTVEKMEEVDREIAENLISRRPGFLSRESAPGSDRSWVAIVHWRSADDADASMESFATAPIAAKFLELIEPGSLVMKRYGR